MIVSPSDEAAGVGGQQQQQVRQQQQQQSREQQQQQRPLSARRSSGESSTQKNLGNTALRRGPGSGGETTEAREQPPAGRSMRQQQQQQLEDVDLQQQLQQPQHLSSVPAFVIAAFDDVVDPDDDDEFRARQPLSSLSGGGAGIRLRPRRVAAGRTSESSRLVAAVRQQQRITTRQTLTSSATGQQQNQQQQAQQKQQQQPLHQHNQQEEETLEGPLLPLTYSLVSLEDQQQHFHPSHHNLNDAVGDNIDIYRRQEDDDDDDRHHSIGLQMDDDDDEDADDYDDDDDDDDTYGVIDVDAEELGTCSTTTQQKVMGSAAIVRSIASFLTLSDAAASLDIAMSATPSAAAKAAAALADTDSWAVGVELQHTGDYDEDHADQADKSGGGAAARPPSSREGLVSVGWSLSTPETPALVRLSPGATPAHQPGYDREHNDHENDDDDDDDSQSDHDEQDDPHSSQQQQQQRAKSNQINDKQIAPYVDTNYLNEEISLERRLQDRRRKWAQEKLAAAVFSHPRSLRTFCVDAYNAAQQIRQQQHQEQQRRIQQQQQQQSSASAALVHMQRPRQYPWLLQELVDLLFNNVPLSVLIDVGEAITGITLETTVANFKITVSSTQTLLAIFGQAMRVAWDTINNMNPFQLLEAIISFQFNAMGKTSEVLVSGIQSVATGVESASSIALNRLSAANLGSATAYNRSTSNNSLGAAVVGAVVGAHHRGSRGALRRTTDINARLLEKMSNLNDAARVVRYMETNDDTGGLTRHAISRTRRMMHYSISLRPFVATVALRPPQDHQSHQQLQQQQQQSQQRGTSSSGNNNNNSSNRRNTRNDKDADDTAALNTSSEVSDSSVTRSSQENSTSSTMTGSISQQLADRSVSSESPVICSPQSFPPTPNHRRRVMAQSCQFADDVVFLARDRLRIHTGLGSQDERTREMARALREGKRLAIFDACAHGIQLTCGQHIATKVGSMHYASTRSMVPVLRNCYVYFEITVMPHFQPVPPPPGGPGTAAVAASNLPPPPVTLSIGLSTAEMPPNTLVGAWQGSVGLCTTGQILAAGQWCSPADPSMSAYGYAATVGCLVFIDDASAFETWDGVMVHASVTFSINGRVVPPPLSTLPLGHTTTTAQAGMMSMTGGLIPSVGDEALVPPSHQPVFQQMQAQQTQARPPTHPQQPLASSQVAKRTPLNRTHAVVVPSSEELYPTVSLQTPGAAVMCRFSKEDVICNKRELVGAPEDATVYAVDGSVIFGPPGGGRTPGSVYSMNSGSVSASRQQQQRGNNGRQ